VNSLVALFLGIMLLVPVPGLANFANPTDPLTGSQSTIRILTLNVMQNSPGVDRAVRFAGIVNFLQTHQVHALALQELSGGSYDTPPTLDSGVDLAGMLGGMYGYDTESAFGYTYSGVDYLLFKVGVMPRYPLEYHSATKLDPPGENYTAPPYAPDPTPNPPYTEFDGRANAVACGLNIPGFGKVNLISTHVYTVTDLAYTATQITNLVKFANDMARDHPARATIIAGDMNFALSPDTQSIYDIFLANGFKDSYREVNADAGSTYGVAGDPYATSSKPARIDFIFVKGSGLQIVSSKVVFDGVNGDYVSDHCGVLTEIRAVSPPPYLLLLGENP
jgi:endonuclease/exonuclease/phosphatase family metal-dependent hydrolase